MENRLVPSNVPVLIVPGEVGTLTVGVNSDNKAQVEAAMERFALHLGLTPRDLTAQIDSLGKESAYTELIDSLEAKGDQEGVDLFVVAQDWRLPIAPTDNRQDGWLSNLTPSLITSTRYQYSTQYLGHWLVKAEEVWEANHSGQHLPYVNVVAHSEGNLITRAYISSPAYGGAFINSRGQVDHLSKIGEYVALAAPNQGTATMFNNLHNNFYQPDALGFTQLRFDIFEAAYYQVARLGRKIKGPEGQPAISRETILNPRTRRPDPLLFLQQYFKVGRDLTATYRSIDGRTINDNPTYSNTMLLDLNASPVRNEFAATVGHMSAIFGFNQNTVDSLRIEVGPGGITEPLTTSKSGFTTKTQPTRPGQVWYQSIVRSIGGDGQVPIQSLVSTFVSDPHISLQPLPNINHITVLTNPAVQDLIYAELQTSKPPPHSVRR
jgi:hypothetical protein